MLQYPSIDVKKSAWKHQQPPNLNALDGGRERERRRERRAKGGVWNSRERGEKGREGSVERSGGGRWCHQQCDICRKTAPLLPRAPTHLLSPLLPSVSRPHPYALEQCQLSLKLLLVLFPLSCSCSLYLKTLFGWNYIRFPPRFPAARLSDREISIHILPPLQSAKLGAIGWI